MKVIDMKRFAEIVGEHKLRDINQFDGKQRCSSDFTLLCSIFNELNDATVENIDITDVSDINSLSVKSNASTIVPVVSSVGNIIPEVVHVSY